MTTYSGHLWLHFHERKSQRAVSINMSNVEYVEADGDNAKVHFVSGATLPLLESLKDVTECISEERRDQHAQGT